MKKSVLIYFILCMIIIASFFCLIVYIATYIFPAFSPQWIIQLPPNPPTPNVKYKEFPFELEYEMNGEKIVIKDTLVCKFNGFIVRKLGKKKERHWNSFLKSGKERITLFENEDVEIFYDVGANNDQIAALYMGDKENASGDIKMTFPNAWITRDNGNNMNGAYIIYANELYTEYKIKLVSWKPSKPIENNFK